MPFLANHSSPISSGNRPAFYVYVSSPPSRHDTQSTVYERSFEGLCLSPRVLEYGKAAKSPHAS
jgi:hypothetical protein